MNRIVGILLLLFCLLPLHQAAAGSDPNDKEGSKDPAIPASSKLDCQRVVEQKQSGWQL